MDYYRHEESVVAYCVLRYGDEVVADERFNIYQAEDDFTYKEWATVKAFQHSVSAGVLSGKKYSLDDKGDWREG